VDVEQDDLGDPVDDDRHGVSHGARVGYHDRARPDLRPHAGPEQGVIVDHDDRDAGIAC
jgi:hypothetical protein